MKKKKMIIVYTVNTYCFDMIYIISFLLQLLTLNFPLLNVILNPHLRCIILKHVSNHFCDLERNSLAFMCIKT